MRRFVLVAFGISAALSPLCTMAVAQAHETPMTHSVACERQNDGSGMCAKQEKNMSSMFHTQVPCTDGSCFIASATQENTALASSVLSFLGTASLPPTLGGPMFSDRATEPTLPQSPDWPPPDILSGVVLRE